MTKRNLFLGSLVAAGMLFGATGAQAGFLLENWTFNANGIDGLDDTGAPGAYTTDGIETWTFNAGFQQDLNDTNGNFTQDAGETGIVQGVGVITGMFDGVGGGTNISSPLLNQNPGAFGFDGYEVSFDFQVGYEVLSTFAGPPPGFNFTHTDPATDAASGLLHIYVDNLSDGSQCSTSSTANCSNGVLVATFLVQEGGGGSVNFNVFDGLDDASFVALFLEDGVWFDEDGNDLGCDDTVVGDECNGEPIALTDSNFDADADGNGVLDTTIAGFQCGDPELGGTQTAAHNCGFEDGSLILQAIPEPASLAIFAIGLMMLGTLVGTLRQQAR